ncbi:magnesium and cobalt transport protein CorA [Candidatus Poribacteria bacterium]|nr:MAG: magnesium and cobalt transport protein CorA [Candidatus Poribacteria bacterium]
MKNPLSQFSSRYSKKVGLPPGSLVYVGEEREEPIQVNLIDYNDSQFQEYTVESVEECETFNNEDMVTWINIRGLHNPDFISSIGEHIGINSMVLEDVMNPTQLPKIEIFDDYIYILLRTLHFNSDTSVVSDEPVNLIIGQNYVVMIHESGEELFKPIYDRIIMNQGRIRKMNSSYLAYALIDLIVDYFFIMAEDISDQLDSIEEEIISDPTPDNLKKINTLRQQIHMMRKPVLSLREVIDEVFSDEIPILDIDTHIYFRDVHDHILQVIQSIETLRIVVSGLFDTYSSALNHKMNEVMKVLTIVATFFIPLTFIAGLYGMNFKFMPELEMRWGYPIILGVMVLIGIIMLIYFKIKKWL